jgi:hypothetical protein
VKRAAGAGGLKIEREFVCQCHGIA